MKLTVLPKMTCDAGCGKCCGPVTINAREMGAIKRYITENGVTPKRQGSTCPMYQGGTCAVYAVRPFVCRMFGHSPRLVCSRGHNVNVTPKDERRLMRRYADEGTPDLWIHSLCFSEDEVMAVLAGALRAG